jgi:chromosomal replication initiation ATPase DnaA
MKNIDRIKSKVNAQRYEMSDFYAVCPIPKADLHSRKRDKDIVRWRQIGMVWLRLSGNTTVIAASHFSLDHSTCIWAEGCVADSFEKYGDEVIRDYLEDLVRFVEGNVMQSEDMNVNEAVCAVLINNRLMQMI